MNNELVVMVLTKYPNANIQAVKNFTRCYERLNDESRTNLMLDAAYHQWSGQTTMAIRWVLKHKYAFKTLAD